MDKASAINHGIKYSKLVVRRNMIDDQILQLSRKSKVKDVKDMFQYDLYYVPFYVIRVRGTASSKLFGNHFREKLISVDALKGFYASADLGSFNTDSFEDSITDENSSGVTFLEPLLNFEQAWSKGGRSIRESHSLSIRHAFWTRSSVVLSPIEYLVIYKPFWLVRITNEYGEFIRVIDGATGEVGGNNGYRFLACLEESNAGCC